MASLSATPSRALEESHSGRRYLHIEAVFVFSGSLDHLSGASTTQAG
jgi:hypothetical protein